MADEQPDPDQSKLDTERRRKRPAPTIELTATDVSSEPNTTAEQPSSAGTHTVPPKNPQLPELPFGLTWPMLLAAIILLQFGVIVLMGALGGRGDDTVLAGRLGTIETQLRSIAERPPLTTIDPRTIDDLAARLAKAEQAAAAPRAPATDPALITRLDSAETALKVMMDSVASLNRRSDDQAALLRDIRARIDALPKAGADPAQVEQLSTRIAALERAGKTIESELRSENATSDRAVRLAVATSALKSAAERSTPFGAELAAVKPLVDANALEPLAPFAASGVPGAAVLAQELSALVPALVRAANPPSQEGGLLDRLQSGASRLVRVRPVDEAPGDDPSAAIARIEAKVKRADVAGALDDLTKLPPAVRAPAEAWITKAQARNAALDVAQKLAAEAFAALGKPAP